MLRTAAQTAAAGALALTLMACYGAPWPDYGGSGSTPGTGGASGSTPGAGGDGAGDGGVHTQCGDGVLDVGEECDDGNHNTSDGCSAECTIELCSHVQPLVLGSSEGTAGPESAGSASLCGAPAAPTSVYEFTPAEAGVLTVTLEAEAEFALSASDTCLDVDALACSSGSAPEILSVQVWPQAPTFVAASGTGAFTLTATFVPSCGDGSLQSFEACDDGNHSSGDGCSSACQIEYDVLCAAAPELPIGQTAGDTTDGTSVFADACMKAGGPEKVYSYTAVEAGILVVELGSDANLGLYILGSCPGSSVSCSNVKPAGEPEVASVSVAAGVTYTVVVDGGTSADAGPFTLDAHFIAKP